MFVKIDIWEKNLFVVLFTIYILNLLGSKLDHSPKLPRMKFRVKKPNISSFTQKIKNKLKKGEWASNRSSCVYVTCMYTVYVHTWYADGKSCLNAVQMFILFTNRVCGTPTT